jgi:hypothetical protein
MALRLGLATKENAISLVSDIRRQDSEEWVAGSGGKPTISSLLRYVELDAGDVYAVVDEAEKCLAIWGVRAWPHWPAVGIAWMVCANGAVHRLHDMHRFFKFGIGQMHLQFPILHAWPLSTNTLHHEWMLRFGFKDSGESAKGAFNTTFLKFTRTETPKVHVLSRSNRPSIGRALSSH